MHEGCNFSAGSEGRVSCPFEEFDGFFFATCAFEFDPDVHLCKSEKVRFTQLLSDLVHFDKALQGFVIVFALNVHDSQKTLYLGMQCQETGFEQGRWRKVRE